jgi:hypothetical protein
MYKGQSTVIIWRQKEVVTRRTITPLPMPDRVIRCIVKLGERCKQKRVSERIQFLNRYKEQFNWGDGTEEDDNDQGLVEAEPHDTDALPAEILGVELESDLVRMPAIQQEQGPTEAELATEALKNANLRHTGPDDEIAEVVEQDLAPHAVTDDEDGAKSEDDDDSDVGLGDQPGEDPQGEVVNLLDEEEPFFNTTDKEQPPDEIQEDQEQAGGVGEEDQDSPSDEQDNSSTGAVRRRSRRIRKKREPTVIDFENRAYAVDDGVLHINPAVLEQAREDTKITSNILFQPSTVQLTKAVRE